MSTATTLTITTPDDAAATPRPALHRALTPVPDSAPTPTPAPAESDRRAERRVARAERRRDPYYDRVADTGTVIVAATAGVASWAGLVLLGEHAGMGAIGPVRIAWLIALCIDVVALIALRAWINTRASAEYRRWGRGISVAALSVSIAGNALGHVLDHKDNWLLTAVVAAIPPLALFAALHLRVLRTQSRREAVDRARERREREQRRRQRTQQTGHDRSGHAAGETSARTADRSSGRTAARPMPKTTDTYADNTADTAVDEPGAPTGRGVSGSAERVAALAATRPDITTAEIATELGVSTRTVRRHLSALKLSGHAIDSTADSARDNSGERTTRQ